MFVSIPGIGSNQVVLSSLSMLKRENLPAPSQSGQEIVNRMTRREFPRCRVRRCRLHAQSPVVRSTRELLDSVQISAIGHILRHFPRQISYSRWFLIFKRSNQQKKEGLGTATLSGKGVRPSFDLCESARSRDAKLL
jgi:hypothetical protein